MWQISCSVHMLVEGGELDAVQLVLLPCHWIRVGFDVLVTYV